MKSLLATSLMIVMCTFSAFTSNNIANAKDVAQANLTGTQIAACGYHCVTTPIKPCKTQKYKQPKQKCPCAANISSCSERPVAYTLQNTCNPFVETYGRDGIGLRGIGGELPVAYSTSTQGVKQVPAVVPTTNACNACERPVAVQYPAACPAPVQCPVACPAAVSNTMCSSDQAVTNISHGSTCYAGRCGCRTTQYQRPVAYQCPAAVQTCPANR